MYRSQVQSNDRVTPQSNDFGQSNGSQSNLMDKLMSSTNLMTESESNLMPSVNLMPKSQM